MQPRIDACCRDIVSVCDEIASLIAPDADIILNDRVVGLAIERLLLIIGEALTQIREHDPTLLDSVSDWKKIIGMRNVIVHAYNRIDPMIVRDAIRDDLPVLRKQVLLLLGG